MMMMMKVRNEMNGTKTKHSTTCCRVFNRYDLSCPRCQELAQGAPARAGWNDMRDAQEARRIEHIRSHVCTREGCGPVCVKFDW